MARVRHVGAAGRGGAGIFCSFFGPPRFRMAARLPEFVRTADALDGGLFVLFLIAEYHLAPYLLGYHK